MKRLTIALGMAVIALLLVALIAGRPAVLLLSTWVEGKQRQVEGATISLSWTEYFYPGNTQTHVLIGRVFSPRSILEIERQNLSTSDLERVFAFECTVLHCTARESVTNSFNGTPVDVYKQSYNYKGVPYIQARYRLASSMHSLRFNGPASEFGESKGTVDRLLGQLAATQ